MYLVNPELAACSPYREAVGDQLPVSPASEELDDDAENLSDETPTGDFDFRTICPWLVGGALLCFACSFMKR